MATLPLDDPDAWIGFQLGTMSEGDLLTVVSVDEGLDGLVCRAELERRRALEE